MKKTIENFGNNIRTLRKKNGWTQIDLANKLNCSQAIITAYENDIRKPPADKIAEIANLFGISVNELFGHIAIKKAVQKKNPKIWKKFEQIEKLPPNDRRTILKMIDALTNQNGNGKK